jgi:amino-acid N-acetyltransferase
MTTISPVFSTDHAAIKLLQTADLPTEDLKDHVSLYTLSENNKIIGTIGMEHDQATALLRSLSVEQSHRGKGYGDTLVTFIENIAKEKGIRTMYLLTTTAETFFAQRGYLTVDRSDAPGFIQETTEFSSTCPASATFMKKDLA